MNIYIVIILTLLCLLLGSATLVIFLKNGRIAALSAMASISLAALAFSLASWHAQMSSVYTIAANSAMTQEEYNALVANAHLVSYWAATLSAAGLLLTSIFTPVFILLGIRSKSKGSVASDNMKR